MREDPYEEQLRKAEEDQRAADRRFAGLDTERRVRPWEGWPEEWRTFRFWRKQLFGALHAGWYALWVYLAAAAGISEPAPAALLGVAMAAVTWELLTRDFSQP